MDGFNKTVKYTIILLCLLIPAGLNAQDREKVAVLPFMVQSLESMDDYKVGLQRMFASIMAGKGYPVISPDAVNQLPNASSDSLLTSDILSLGKELKADWIIRGSLTKIGEKVSLDLNVTDVRAINAPFSIFMIADNMAKLDETLENSAASIDNRISGISRISSIQVRGNRRVETDAVLAIIESKKGDRIDQDQLDRDLHDVYGMGFFSDVNIETEDGPDGKNIIFNLKEKPVIIQILYEGNKKYKEDKLNEELGIKQYSIYNENNVKQSINRLKEFYRKKGYYNSRITDKIKEHPNNEISLIYVIEEGKKVYIKRIEFIGNEKFSDKALKKVMLTSEKDLFSWISDAGILDSKKLEYDILQLTSFYNNNGYIKVKIGEPEIEYNAEKNGLTITISVIEGDQYQVNEVLLEGDIIKPKDELMKHITVNKEKAFNREVMYNDIEELKDVYTDEGYAYTHIRPLSREDPERKLVDITYKIDKKKRVRIQRINITGNSTTRDKVIRRELKLVEGEYFSGINLDKSEENLNRLDFFEEVETETRNGSQDDLMMVDIHVKERATGSFNIGVGYSSWEKLIMMVQISKENLFGKGQGLNLQAQVGSRTTEFNLSFTEPWLFDKDLSSSIGIYNWQTQYDEYTRDSRGGALGIGFPLGIDEYTRGSIRYAYDDARIKDVLPTAALSIQNLTGWRITTSSMSLGIGRDSRDQLWNTTKGSVNTISMEYTGGILGGDSAFSKYTAVSAWYFPVLWKTVLMARGNLGYIVGREEEWLPIYEKFRLGGVDSVRGYEWGDIVPIDPATGGDIGGDKMWLLNIEYRIPVLKKQGVWGFLFFDAGNAFRKEDNWRTGARRSMGFGMRWRSPMGPLQMEYGIKLDPKRGDSSGEFEFNVGGNF